MGRTSQRALSWAAGWDRRTGKAPVRMLWWRRAHLGYHSPLASGRRRADWSAERTGPETRLCEHLHSAGARSALCLSLSQKPVFPAFQGFSFQHSSFMEAPHSYSSPPLLTGDVPPGPQRVPAAVDSTKPSTYCFFSTHTDLRYSSIYETHGSTDRGSILTRDLSSPSLRRFCLLVTNLHLSLRAALRSGFFGVPAWPAPLPSSSGAAVR